MNKDEALDLALEALEDLQRQYSIYPNSFWDWSKGRGAITAIKQARSAPVQEPVAIPDCGEAGHAEGACGNRECLPSFRRNTTPPAAQPATVQEPVAVVKVLPLGDGQKPMRWADWTDADNPPPEGTLLYTAAQPAPVQEPVAWAGHNLDDMCEAFDRVIEEHASRKNPFHDPVNKDAMIALRILRGFVPYMKRYTTSPAAQRPWVGLSQDEFIDLCEEASNFGTGGLIRHIEAKLREKNT